MSESRVKSFNALARLKREAQIESIGASLRLSGRNLLEALQTVIPR